jgi:hypothetical protein
MSRRDPTRRVSVPASHAARPSAFSFTQHPVETLDPQREHERAHRGSLGRLLLAPGCIHRPMAAALLSIHAPCMRGPFYVPLCRAELGRRELGALLDELCLTYHVVERTPDGKTRRLKAHLLSLAEARSWACALRDEQLREPGQAPDAQARDRAA